MEDLRVLHVIPNLIKGGAQRIAIDICRELHLRQNCFVKLVYFERENEFEFLTKDIDIEKINISFNISLSGKSNIQLQAFEQLVDNFKPNVIHSHLYLAELISREHPRKGVRYFTHCHDNIVQLRKPQLNSLFKKADFVNAFERRRLLKKYALCDNSFIAIAKDGVKFLKKNLPYLAENKIILLHNAINFVAFNVERENNFESHKLVNVGNFIENKNQSFLIDCLHKLQINYTNLKLHLVGDGITFKTVENKVHNLNLSTNVVFYGKTDHVVDVLKKSTIYVHSAKSEQYGLVILEAMAAGLPVVSLDGKGNRDFITDGVNGFLVEQGDLNRFVECIERLIEDEDLYLNIQKEGLETAKRHDILSYVDRLVSIYKLENKNYVI